MKITLKRVGETSNKVIAIKALRNLAGLGLKEAKDAVEEAMCGVTVTFDSSRKALDLTGSDSEAFRDLKGQGILVVGGAGKRGVIITATRSSAKMAVDEGEYELAISLINVLKEHDIV